MATVAGERKHHHPPGKSWAAPRMPAVRPAWNKTSQINGEPLLSVKPPHLPERYQSINSVHQQLEQQGTTRHAPGKSLPMQASSEVQAKGDNKKKHRKYPGTTGRDQEYPQSSVPDIFLSDCIAFWNKGRERKPAPTENPQASFRGFSVLRQDNRQGMPDRQTGCRKRMAQGVRQGLFYIVYPHVSR